MGDIRSTVKRNRNQETTEAINKIIDDLTNEGYEVEFGSIGKRTTYAMIYRGDEEIVGYTFIKNLAYKNELVGRLKALQQAIARKTLQEAPKEPVEAPENV